MTGPWESRARASDDAYRDNPERGRGDAMGFLPWALTSLRGSPGTREIVEVGCGSGEDAGRLALEGYRVKGIDFSAVAIERAIDHQRTLREPFRSRIEFVHGEAGQFLLGRPPGSADAVIAHLVYMSWSEDEIDTVLGAVHRVLRPGGLHLFAVRATSDPLHGQGACVAPHTFQGGPHAFPYRYYTLADTDRFTRRGFERVSSLATRATHRLYIADRRAEGSPDAPPLDPARGS